MGMRLTWEIRKESVGSTDGVAPDGKEKREIARKRRVRGSTKSFVI